MNKHYKIFFAIVVIIIIVFAIKIKQESASADNIKKLSIQYKAKSLADLLISFRKVYQDIFIQEHIQLDKSTIDFLPVKTTNKIAELFSSHNAYTKFTTVSDTPRNAVNMANKRQLDVIENFNKNKKLEYIFKEIDGTYYYSQPLYISKVCLKCHGKKENAPSIIKDNYNTAYNYKLGDLRGIIDIELKQTEVSEILTEKGKSRVIFILLFVFFLILILYLYTRYIIKLDEEKDEAHEKETLDILLHSLPMAVQGYNENREVIYWNKTSEELYGYKFDEIKNKKIEDLIIPDFMKNDAIKAIDNWYQNDIHIPSSELPLIKKDASTVYVYSTYIMITQKSGDRIIFCMDLDLTEQKESQKKDSILAEQSKMAAMGEMIGNIAHQWRQPLSIISTASTGMKMQKEFDKLSDDQLLKNCDIINENAQYLSKTIDDFKNFIKGDRTKQLFKLEDEIDSFLSLINASVKNHNIEIVLNTQKDIKINGYANELKQCLINIFNNSKDALKENVEKDRVVFISAYIKNNNAIIEIKDNAGGIPKDILPQIFEPYFTTKHKSQGTGLGLHMTYNLIVDGMGGIIEAKNVNYEYKNVKYVGAEFQITLPV
ncbi:MAG: DUF3365 domain-containing protein [Campylobacterota bacterium]|nr:DUF3365 domain-containing protein [Campylobacterota bacterium]